MTGYKHSEPWDVGFLPVDDVHKLYYEQYGPRDGKTGMPANQTFDQTCCVSLNPGGSSTFCTWWPRRWDIIQQHGIL